ncbi:hypothetical protein Y032_0098g3058 [Ancylostoma ceylanicum]|uniref:Uncharacterized protein n=1 Tax=Ancylostoma ceylanicum TaxID=53326 RepID=A0A016TJB3_9BILA|nr:hypothetical protein Y032_0098g3058 [Ancylostoma ceylanicum]
MAALVLLLAVIAAAEACAPTTPTTVTTGRKRRAAEVVLVTVVTNQKYKPSMNDAHLQTMKALLNDYTTSKKVVYDKRMVHERPSNVGGRFAVVYTVRNADCGQKLNDLFYEILPHPAYSSEKSPMDCHFYKHLDNFIKGRMLTRPMLKMPPANSLLSKLQNPTATDFIVI